VKRHWLNIPHFSSAFARAFVIPILAQACSNSWRVASFDSENREDTCSAEKRQIDAEVQRTVINIIEQIATGGDKALRELSTKFDRWDRDDYRLSKAEIERRALSSVNTVRDFANLKISPDTRPKPIYA
jgi:hypothetical protein